MSGFINESLVLEGAIQANNLDAAAMASRADVNVIGYQAELIRVAVAAAGNTDIVMPYAVRVIDVWAVRTGGAGGAAQTIQVLNAAAAISNAMDLNIADTTIARATSIDRTNRDIAQGGTLRVAGVTAGVAGICYVLVVRN